MRDRLPQRPDRLHARGRRHLGLLEGRKARPCEEVGRRGVGNGCVQAAGGREQSPGGLVGA